MISSPPASRPRLLVIDDDRKLCRLIADYLHPLGYDVTTVHTGPAGVERATTEAWQAVILDLMLPGLDGFEVLKQIRRTSDVPVLMLTARGDEADRIVGLEIGADDYLPKTFSTRELLARIRAVTRRSVRAPAPGKDADAEIVIDKLRINPGARTAALGDHALVLTPVEFELLLSLARAKGRVKTRDHLLEEIREREYEVFDRSIDVHISALRKKLGDDPKTPHFIRTVRAAGYMLIDPDADAYDPPQLRGVRFPLSVKILLWFFLNLAFLGAAGWLAVHGQLRMGLDSLLAGPVNDRLQDMGAVVAQQLNDRPRERWNEILQNTSNAYHVQVAVFRNDGTRLAGQLDLPEEVNNRLREIHPGRRPADEPPPPRGVPPLVAPGDQAGPPRRNGTMLAAPIDVPGLNDPPGANGAPPPRPVPLAIQGSFPKMMLHTSKPSLYWVLIRLPVVDTQKRPPSPTTLIMATDSLRLLFDYRPWLLGGGAVLVVSMLLWLPLVRGITRALRQMTGAAESIAQGRFDTQVDTPRADELGRLGSALNNMSARLREFFTGQKRFLGDIAHELCSPLARMEMALGILDQRADESQRDYVADVREELRHMSELVHELLSFSKAGVGGKNVELKPVPLAELTGRVVARETKERGGVVVDVPGSLAALAEPDLLARALGNVIRNALRYASPVHGSTSSYSYRPTVQVDGRPAGPITVSARDRGEQVSILVTDCGPGVPEEALHRLFDPFFRPESARTRETGGTGLGLAIVKSCIEACGGTVAVRNVKPSGLQVEFELRRAQPQSAGKSRMASTAT